MPASNLNAAFQFSRQFGVPLDKDLVFATTNARNSYLTDAGTSGIAYTGMIVADLQTNKVYVLDSSRAWKEVGITVNETFGASNSGMLFKTGDNTFAVRGLSSGNNIDITNPSGLAGNPSIALSSSVTGLTSLGATTVTFTSGTVSSKLAVSGSLTLNGRDITTSIEAAPNTNTANFNLSVGSVSNVGTNGGPSYYGTYDQGGNVREIMYSGSTAVPMRGGNFASDDQLIKTYRGSQTPTNYGPGFGVRLASRENIGKSYPLSLTVGAATGISTSGSVIHNFQIGDPLKFANDNGLPGGLSSGVTYYVVGTGSTTFAVSTTVGGSAVSVTGAGTGTTSTYSAYDYGSFVRVENSGNAADTTNYGAVNYNYRIGKFELTNDEYVEFLNATARDDHDSGSAYYVNTVDMGLYDPMMETEAPNNGISRNAVFPDYYYASLRGMNKKPVVFISYVDAARYCNWLHNGKPTAARYRSVVTSLNNSETTVYLANHGYVDGDEISFNCADGSTFGGTLTKNTKYIVAYLTADTFKVKTVSNGDVSNPTNGQFYVRKYFNKSLINSGSYTVANNESTAPAKIAAARYWIPTENEWYKAAYYDPSKGGVGVPGYWNYPTRSDTVPSGVVADANGNGTYNPGGAVPGHYHSSYDISDFADRIDNLLADGNGTQVIYSPNAAPASIVVNVTGIPLSTVVDVRATATEVNYLSGVNPGTGVASRALVLNANKSISGIANLVADTGVFTSGSFGASTSSDSASTLRVGGTGVSLSGHKHYYSAGTGFADIPNFCSGVADCVNTQLVVSTGLRADLVSSNLQLALSGQAATLHTFSSNGIIVRSGGSANNGTFAARSIASGANINVTNGNAIDGNPTIALAPSVTGLTDLTVDQIKIDGTTISTTGNNDSITLAPHGTGDVNIDADTLRVGDSNGDVTITTNGTGDLTLNTNSGTNSSSITIADAANGDITLTAHGNGEVNINKVDIDSGNIDGTTIGSSSAAAGTFTAVTVDNTKIDNDKLYRSNVARIDIDSSETVINSPNNNVNFRVSGSGAGNSNLLFVDAANNRVGIGTNSPLSAFSVSGAVNFNSTITAPNIGSTTSSNSLVTLDGGLLKTRSVDSRVWGTSLVDGDGNGSAGGIPYWSDSNSLTQSSNLFWNSTNNRLGIGTSTPLTSLDVRGDAGVSGNFSVGGNLTVTGTTVIANVDILRIKDPVILLGSGTTATDVNNDRGLSLALSASVTGFMGWDTSETEFVVLSSGVPNASSGTYAPGTYGAFRAGTINSTGSFNGMVVNATGSLNTSAGATNGQINLNGSNGNFISWNTNGQGVPTTTVRSSGTKLVFYPDLAGGNTDTAIGTDNAGQTLWQSIKTGSQASFKWYVGTSEKANLDTNGNFATSGNITSNGTGGFTGNGSSVTGVNAYALNIYSNSQTDTTASLVMITGTSTGNYRPFIDSGLKFNANTDTLILSNISGTLTSAGYTSGVFTSTTISGVGSIPTYGIVNFIIDGGTP
jgi:formylglycine-generating enzyme required for sulfatase activity